MNQKEQIVNMVIWSVICSSYYKHGDNLFCNFVSIITKLNMKFLVLVYLNDFNFSQLFQVRNIFCRAEHLEDIYSNFTKSVHIKQRTTETTRTVASQDN